MCSSIRTAEYLGGTQVALKLLKALLLREQGLAIRLKGVCAPNRCLHGVHVLLDLAPSSGAPEIPGTS